MAQEKPLEVSQGFPDNLSETQKKPFGNPKETPEKTTYASTELAALAGVSVVAWRKSWLHFLLQVAPEHQLKRGRQYTQLAWDLTASLKDSRDRGWTGESWLELEAWPKWGNRNVETPEVMIDRAYQSGQIVPVEVVEAADGQRGALAEAQQIRGFAEMLVEEMFTALIDGQTHSLQADRAIDAEAIAAEELLNIAEEERIRAQIRANYAARKRQASAGNLARRMDQFKNQEDK